jgi:hypothetical protein
VRDILSKKMLRLALSAAVSCPRELCGRMISNHPVQTRDFFGFREPLRSDVDEVSEGLGNEGLAQEQDIDHLVIRVMVVGRARRPTEPVGT